MNGIANWIVRGFALVVTDRRWAAPLSAMALGFGLFVGVAIGPSAAGSLAGTAQIAEQAAPGRPRPLDVAHPHAQAARRGQARPVILDVEQAAAARARDLRLVDAERAVAVDLHK